MGNEFQNIIDQDNLEVARNNLNEFTGKLYKKRYINDIEEMDNKRLDEMQLGFLSDNEDLSFKDIRLVKRVFDYLKGGK